MINNAIKFIFETFKIIIRLLPLKRKIEKHVYSLMGKFPKQKTKQNKTKTSVLFYSDSSIRFCSLDVTSIGSVCVSFQNFVSASMYLPI